MNPDEPAESAVNQKFVSWHKVSHIQQQQMTSVLVPLTVVESGRILACGSWSVSVYRHS